MKPKKSKIERLKAKAYSVYLFVYLFALLFFCNSALAQSYYDDSMPTNESFIFKLITGGFGAFIVIFFGLGGLGSLFLTRSGNSSKRTPMLGVIMLLFAGVTFAYRVAIRAGMMGHEYIQW